MLSSLFKVKTDFHVAKIDTVNLSEEDMKHSEKRVRELEDEIRRINELLQKGNYRYVGLRANLTLEFCPDYYNV